MYQGHPGDKLSVSRSHCSSAFYKSNCFSYRYFGKLEWPKDSYVQSTVGFVIIELLSLLCFIIFKSNPEGPYYKYRTYIDTMNQKNSKNIPTVERMLKRLAELPAYAACFMVIGHFYYIQVSM